MLIGSVWLADGRAEHSPSYLQRLLFQLQICGSYIAHCHPSSLQWGQQAPDRPDSMQQQPQQQSVQEPVLVLTTSHLLVLEPSCQPICAIPLQGTLVSTMFGVLLLCGHCIGVQWVWHVGFMHVLVAVMSSLLMQAQLLYRW